MAHGDTVNPRMLLVSNLDTSVTEVDLYYHFKVAGDQVIWAQVCTDKSTCRHLGQGYVSFAQPEHADKAIAQLDHSVLKGKVIHVAKSSFSFNKVTVTISDEEEDLKTDEEFASVLSKFGPFVWIRQFVHQAGERYLVLYFQDHQGAARAAAALQKGQFFGDLMLLHSVALVDVQQEQEFLRQGSKNNI